jgi:methanogenic corrinoid protein MtbC1
MQAQRSEPGSTNPRRTPDLEAVPESAPESLHEACVVDFAARQCQGGGGEQARIDQLVRALEHAVIPYLAQAHRPCEPSPLPLCAVPTAAEVQGFVAQLMVGADAPTQALLAQLRRRGMTVEALYLDLLAPAARLLGEYWDNDLADFAAVTVGLGQLQRLLRDLSPDFSIDLGSRAHARRVLLVQAPHEQHSFGLSMVAEFFRRDGWVVEGGVGTAAADPVVRVQNDWYDVSGFLWAVKRVCGGCARRLLQCAWPAATPLWW